MAGRIILGIIVTCSLNLGLLLFGPGDPGAVAVLYPLGTAFVGGLIGSSELTNYYHRLVSWGRFRRFGKVGLIMGSVVAAVSTVIAVMVVSLQDPAFLEGAAPAIVIGEIFLFYLIPSVIGGAVASELVGEVKGYELDHHA